jgi:hypothetical protein
MDANDGLAALKFLLRATTADPGYGRARYWAGRACEMLGEPEHAAIQYSRLAFASSLRELSGDCLGDAQEQLLAHNMVRSFLALAQNLCDQGMGDLRLLARCARHGGAVPEGTPFMNYVREDGGPAFVAGKNLIASQGVCAFAAPPRKLVVSVTRKSASTNAWDVLPLAFLLHDSQPQPGTRTYLWQTDRGKTCSEETGKASRKILGQPQTGVFVPEAGLSTGDELVIGLADETSCGKLIVRSQPHDADILINGCLTGNRTPGVVHLRPGSYETALQYVKKVRLSLAESSFGGYWKQGCTEPQRIGLAGGATVKLNKEVPFRPPVVGWQDFSLPKVDNQRVLWRSNRKCRARGYAGTPQMVMNVLAQRDEIYVLWSAWMNSEYADSLMETWIARCDRTFRQTDTQPLSIPQTRIVLQPCLTSDGDKLVLIFWDQADQPGQKDLFMLRSATSPDGKEWTAGEYLEGTGRRVVLGALTDDSPMRGSLPFAVHRKADGKPFAVLASGEVRAWTGNTFERAAPITVDMPDNGNTCAANVLATCEGGVALLGYPTNRFCIAREKEWPRYALRETVSAAIASPAACRQDPYPRPWHTEQWRIFDGGQDGLWVTDAVNVWKLADLRAGNDPKTPARKAEPFWTLPADYRTLIAAGLERLQVVTYRMDAAMASDGTFCRAIFGYYGGASNHPLGKRLYERPFVLVGYGHPEETR